MIKSIFVFIIVFALFFLGINFFRSLGGKEKWQMTKLVTYSALCALLALLSLSVIVFLF